MRTFKFRQPGNLIKKINCSNATCLRFVEHETSCTD